MTTTDTTTHNLLFLLAAAPLGLGCIIVSDDTDDTTAADTGSQTTSGGTTEATTGNETGPSTATGDGTSSSGPADSTSRGESSGADSTGADSTGGTTGACADYGAAAIECAVPYAEYAEGYCNYSLDYQQMFSAECGMAYEDLIACLSALPCEDFAMGPTACQTQLDALLALGCPAVE